MFSPSPDERLYRIPDPGSVTPVRERGDALLPVPLTRLIGRDGETAAVCALLRRADVRLVTLTGPGGVGKTRLALRVARELDADFAGGTHFVSLAAIADPDLVLSTVAHALGMHDTSGQPIAAYLRSTLRQRSLLLILDNLEQVLPAASELAALLAACPGLTILATSRALLRVSGEHGYSVPPLSPAEAAQLFVHRARAVDPSLTLSERTTTAIATICHRLDGLPLAIELAAARSNLFSPEALVTRLERRLPMLTGGPRDQPPRLQTMREAIAWSYDLLSGAEQRLFRRLAVFVGSFALEAAEWVSGVGDRVSEESGSDPRSPTPDTFVLVSSLLDQSLLRRVETPGAEPRVAMLETVREYGLERLTACDEQDLAREAHATYCLALAERAEPKLADADWQAWVDRLVRELPNLRAALGYWRERGDGERAVRLAGALGLFWTQPAYVREGRAWLEMAVALPDAERAPASLATALNAIGMVAQWQGDSAGAEEALTRALPIREALHDELGVAEVFGNLGNAALDAGDLERAETLLAECLPIYEQHGQPIWVGETLMLLGHTVRARGDLDRSAEYHEAAVAVLRDLPGHDYLSDAWLNLSWAALLRGDLTRAGTACAEGLAVARAEHDLLRLGRAVCGAAGLAAIGGDEAGAARLFAFSAGRRDEDQIPLKPTIQAEHDQLVTRVRETLGDVAFAAAWAAGRAISLDDALGEAQGVLDLAGKTGPAGSPRTVAAPAITPLTPRERDVLRRLTEGLADKEIAATLGITRRTASNHVAAILDKLGAPSRTVAATIAIRDNLV